jgi:hypothetical protein
MEKSIIHLVFQPSDKKPVYRFDYRLEQIWFAFIAKPASAAHGRSEYTKSFHNVPPPDAFIDIAWARYSVRRATALETETLYAFFGCL